MQFTKNVMSLFLAATVGGAFVWMILSYDIVRLPGSVMDIEPAALEMTYSDFVTFLLMVVTVVLAAIALGIGVAAAYTFENIERKVDKRVDERVTSALDGLEGRMIQIVYGTRDDLDSELEQEEER